jgi:hypothetical protein
MPKQISLHELMEKLIILEKIERGNEQSEKGMITPNDQLDDKLPEWLK